MGSKGAEAKREWVEVKSQAEWRSKKKRLGVRGRGRRKKNE